MVSLTCPLCSQTCFDNLESLRTRLITAATQRINCPVCEDSLLGLDKFTIHLFGHSSSDVKHCQSELHNGPPKNDDPLCTINLEDLNFLTTWQVPGPAMVTTETNSNFRVKDEKSQNNCLLESDSSENLFSASCEEPAGREIPLFIKPKLFESDIQSDQLPNVCVSGNERVFLESQKTTQAVDSRQLFGMLLSNSLDDSKRRIDRNSCRPTPVGTKFTEDVPIKTIAATTLDTSHDLLEILNESNLLPLPGYVPEKNHNSNIIDNGTEDSLPADSLKSLDSSESGRLSGVPTSALQNLHLSEYISEPLQQHVTPTATTASVNLETGNTVFRIDNQGIEKTPDPYPCKLCGRGFRMRGSLLVHSRVAHAALLQGDAVISEQRQFNCSQCIKSFKKEQHLSQHMKTHDGKQWKCETCSKFFTTKYFLKKHQRLHTGEMPYCCETCNKTFTFQQSYHKHLLYHSSDKPHECSDCGRAFKELSTLHNHQRIHSGEKPFACETCGKCFRQRVSYIVHQRIHTGVLPYQCTACKKKFRYKVSQRSHKCTAQPPGVVVRQPGDLIQRILQQRPNILECLQ